MKKVTLPLLLLVCSMATTTQKEGQDSKKRMAPQAVCDAAAPKLRESGTSEVVLTMVLDTQGRVESFKTESPKGLRLEKMKEAAAAIKAMKFQAARKDGRPVKVMVTVELDCSRPAADTLKEP